MMILAILVGLALAFFGRQLFWLFVGGAGFAAGMMIATDLLQGQSDLMVLIVAVVVGVIGALLSIFLQKFAIGLAGFIGGGYGMMHLAGVLGHAEWAWLGFIVGGIVGALLVMILFDWALILLSAIMGALLVVDNVKLDPAVAFLVFGALCIAGVLAQSAQLRRRAAPVPAAPERVEPS